MAGTAPRTMGAYPYYRFPKPSAAFSLSQIPEILRAQEDMEDIYNDLHTAVNFCVTIDGIGAHNSRIDNSPERRQVALDELREARFKAVQGLAKIIRLRGQLPPPHAGVDDETRRRLNLPRLIASAHHIAGAPAPAPAPVPAPPPNPAPARAPARRVMRPVTARYPGVHLPAPRKPLSEADKAAIRHLVSEAPVQRRCHRASEPAVDARHHHQAGTVEDTAQSSDRRRQWASEPVLDSVEAPVQDSRHHWGLPPDVNGDQTGSAQAPTPSSLPPVQHAVKKLYQGDDGSASVPKRQRRN